MVGRILLQYCWRKSNILMNFHYVFMNAAFQQKLVINIFKIGLATILLCKIRWSAFSLSLLLVLRTTGTLFFNSLYFIKESHWYHILLKRFTVAPAQGIGFTYFRKIENDGKELFDIYGQYRYYLELETLKHFVYITDKKLFAEAKSKLIICDEVEVKLRLNNSPFFLLCNKNSPNYSTKSTARW